MFRLRKSGLSEIESLGFGSTDLVVLSTLREKERREEKSVGAKQQCQKVLPSSRHSRRNQG